MSEKKRTHVLVKVRDGTSVGDRVINSEHIDWPTVMSFEDPSDPAIKSVLKLIKPGGLEETVLTLTVVPEIVSRVRLSDGPNPISLKTSGGFYAAADPVEIEDVLPHSDGSDPAIKSLVKFVHPGGVRSQLPSIDTPKAIYKRCVDNA